MIFVTVGTHEQSFGRLVEYMDNWARENDEKVIIQIGYTIYEPKNCEWKRLYGYEEMQEKISAARIIITHGGPSSFIAPIQVGKIPIVVPRKREFDEHVNDHQSLFAHEVAKRIGNIIVVDDVNELGNIISDYDSVVEGMNSMHTSNNSNFNFELNKIVKSLFGE